MARKSPQRPNAEEPKAGADEATPDVDAPDPAGPASESAGKPARDPVDDPVLVAEDTVDEDADEDEDADAGADVDRSLWTDARVDPVEIALPAGVGYTLRAYRLSTALAATDVDGREEDDDPFAVPVDADADDDEVVILDDEYAALLADDSAEPGDAKSDDETADAKTTADGRAKDSVADETAADDEEKEEEANEHDEEATSAEEVPFFLTHRGRLLLFKSPESLVAFVRSGAPHDLAQLDTWPELADRIRTADVAVADDDSYELDLVVENLRGGNETWDLNLLIRGGEIARDLAYALRLPAVLAALSPGSPLDDLDESLRAAAGGGIGGFMGRRRLRRIGAQQASLGWRTIIGKISAAVDWRD